MLCDTGNVAIGTVGQAGDAAGSRDLCVDCVSLAPDVYFLEGQLVGNPIVCVLRLCLCLCAV